ncbi:MAG: Metal dependent phosphohydrolase [Clostridia bacterium 41_269]|nr:MAG: Metal dependent phosphohydrolase [Clostridia bacterium 41_269]
MLIFLIKKTKRMVRVQYITSSFLHPGMVSSGSLYDWEGRKILEKDEVITENKLMELRELQIPAVIVCSNGRRVKKSICIEEIYKNTVTIKEIVEFQLSEEYTLRDIVEADVLVEKVLRDRRVLSWLLKIAAHDPSTFFHSVKTCVVAAVFGIKAELDERSLFCLAKGSLLHDLGKTKISVEILNKKGYLTQIEWKIVKKHPLWGAELLALEDTGCEEIIPLVINHHENEKGTGYPRGIKGPLNIQTALCSIADIYSAITSDRPYRRAVSHKTACGILEKAGKERLADESLLEKILF